MTIKKQALVNLLGTIFLLFPTTLLILFSSLGYVHDSWNYREVSQEAGGLQALYILKGVIPLAAILLTLQGLSLALRSVLVLMGITPQPDAARASEKVLP